MSTPKSYKLKAEYNGKTVNRPSSVSGAKVTFDATKVKEADYHKYVKIGFADIFEDGDAKPSKEEIAYQKRVDRLTKAGFKLVAEDTFTLEVEGKEPETVDKVKEATDKDFNAFMKPFEK